MSHDSHPDVTSSTSPRLPAVASSQSFFPRQILNHGSNQRAPQHDVHNVKVNGNPCPTPEEWAVFQRQSPISFDNLIKWFRDVCLRENDSQRPYSSRPSSTHRNSVATSLRSIESFPSTASSVGQDSIHEYPPRFDSLQPFAASANGEPLVTSHSTIEQKPLPALQGPTRKRKTDLLSKYFCTYCKKDFTRKDTWKRHEAEFHEWQEEYPCGLPNCHEKFHSKYRFNRHHQELHGCGKDCSHAAANRVILPKKIAWGCGYCGNSLDTWEHRMQHIGGQHYETEGKTRTDWLDSSVILGLLWQPKTAYAWSLLLKSQYGEDTPYCTWSASAANELQARLEWQGDWTADQLVTEAFRLMNPFGTDQQSTNATWAQELMDIVFDDAIEAINPGATSVTSTAASDPSLQGQSRSDFGLTLRSSTSTQMTAASTNAQSFKDFSIKHSLPVVHDKTPPLPPSPRMPRQHVAFLMAPQRSPAKRGQNLHPSSHSVESFMDLD